MNRARRSVKFERKPSQRYSRRPGFDKRELAQRLQDNVRMSSIHPG